jgi:SAM-dependent methyltransferase
MTPEDEEPSARTLAEEIRRGIREALPHRSASLELDSPAARAWEQAERYVLPSVEPGASLPFVKKAVLRLLRVVTRSQGAFNTQVLQGTRALERSVTELRRELEQTSRRLAGEQDVLQARMGLYEGRSGVAAGRDPTVASGARPAVISDGLYARFEEEFRGSRESIGARQREYAEFFRGAPGRVLDCGCGRGEFVGLLTETGIPAEGIDASPVAVALARDRGLEVELGDVFERLRSRPGSLGGIAALQLVEHLDPGAVREFLGLAYEALAPGGRLLLETINPDSLYAMRAFRLDPTHRWPVPAATLSLFARDAGFAPKEVRLVSPVPPEEALEETGENERKLNRWIFGFQDYALFAERPRD